MQQPAYAPELNPAERFFEELRRVVGGKVYQIIEAKVAAIEAELREWDKDPDRVRRLVGWSWIMDTLGQPHPSEGYVAWSHRIGIRYKLLFTNCHALKPEIRQIIFRPRRLYGRYMGSVRICIFPSVLQLGKSLIGNQ